MVSFRELLKDCIKILACMETNGNFTIKSLFTKDTMITHFNEIFVPLDIIWEEIFLILWFDISQKTVFGEKEVHFMVIILCKNYDGTS